MIAKFRPLLPIIAITPNIRTARELNLVWGMQAEHIKQADFFDLDIEDMIEASVLDAVKSGILDENEHVIILVVSKKFQKRGNLIGLYYVGEIVKKASSQ